MLVTAMGLLMLARAVSAQDVYPSKPFTLVMPYAIGGGANLMARVLADFIRKILGQPVTVLNVVPRFATLAALNEKGSVPNDDVGQAYP